MSPSETKAAEIDLTGEKWHFTSQGYTEARFPLQLILTVSILFSVPVAEWDSFFHAVDTVIEMFPCFQTTPFTISQIFEEMLEIYYFLHFSQEFIFLILGFQWDMRGSELGAQAWENGSGVENHLPVLDTWPEMSAFLPTHVLGYGRGSHSWAGLFQLKDCTNMELAEKQEIFS